MARSVCPHCLGTGMVSELPIEQDGFRYVPNDGLRYRGARIPLKGQQLKIVGALIARPGIVVTKNGLMQYLGSDGETKMVDTVICRARREIREHTELQPIKTVWGRGLSWSV